MKKNRLELILEIGAAGGSISVWSVSNKDGIRSFVITTDETTLKDFMDEEDANSLSFKSKTGLLSSFADALTALENYPWHRLYPMFVHQNFVDSVLTAVMTLGGKKEVTRWKQKLNL